jgi:lysophospholipase L1-like esterase
MRCSIGCCAPPFIPKPLTTSDGADKIFQLMRCPLETKRLHTRTWAAVNGLRGGMLLVAAFVIAAVSLANAANAKANESGQVWIGTWATAAQPAMPGALQSFRNQTLRLIVHTSAGGTKARIKISNTYGDQPLVIGGAHVARRTEGADIDPASDRTLKFGGQATATVPARSMVVSDPVDLDVPPMSDLAISLFLPRARDATTNHILAKQTSYVSESGDSCATVKFPVAKKIRTWPFLTGVDVAAAPGAFAIVAFGSSLTDGDGSTLDTNGRYPDVLAQRLQKEGGRAASVGVLNEGIIGNRLLSDSPQQAGSPFGAALGQSGLARFDRDVLEQAGVKYVIVGLGINDIAFPGSLTPANEALSAEDLIAGYRKLITRAHTRGVRIVGSTNPAFENSLLKDPPVTFYTPEKEAVRQKVNEWIRTSGEFDGVIDFDEVVRDPSHPTQILPAYDSGDHLHPNNAGYAASGSAIPLSLFKGQ